MIVNSNASGTVKYHDLKKSNVTKIQSEFAREKAISIRSSLSAVIGAELPESSVTNIIKITLPRQRIIKNPFKTERSMTNEEYTASVLFFKLTNL